MGMEERPIPPAKDDVLVVGGRELDGRGRWAEFPAEGYYAEVEAVRGVEMHQPPAELPWHP